MDPQLRHPKVEEVCALLGASPLVIRIMVDSYFLFAESTFSTLDILRRRLHEKIEESRGQVSSVLKMVQSLILIPIGGIVFTIIYSFKPAKQSVFPYTCMFCFKLNGQEHLFKCFLQCFRIILDHYYQGFTNTTQTKHKSSRLGTIIPLQE